MRFCEGLIAHGQIYPGLFVYDAFVMAERFEACFAVVRARAARAEPAEGKVGRGKVNDRIVDATAAEAQARG